MTQTFSELLKKKGGKMTAQDLLDPEVSRAIKADHHRAVYAREEAEDRYYEELGNLLEQHPPHTGPGRGLGIRVVPKAPVLSEEEQDALDRELDFHPLGVGRGPGKRRKS
jgi:hypothetical protein